MAKSARVCVGICLCALGVMLIMAEHFWAMFLIFNGLVVATYTPGGRSGDRSATHGGTADTSFDGDGSGGDGGGD